MKDSPKFKNIPIPVVPDKDSIILLILSLIRWKTFLVPFLSDITQNEFTVKNSFAFVDETLTQGSDLYMASLDVDTLFTNIPVDETINIYVKKLFLTLETLVPGISKNDFRDLLNLTTNESFFTFNSTFYSSRLCCYGLLSRSNIG